LALLRELIVKAGEGSLTWGDGGKQTANMAHIYMVFDFATDEEKLQQARHKLEGWKQAFRLDKKLLYKLERVEAATGDGDGSAVTPKAEKAEKPAKTKGKAKAATEQKKPEVNADVKLLVRLAFSGHEKLTEQRWVQRIPVEEPFQGASPRVVKSGEQGFEDVEKKFDELS